MILAVAIDTPLRRMFDYRAPAQQPDIAPGQRVWVPFGRRRVVGVVVERRDRTDVPAAKLRSVFAAVDEEPTFDAKLLQLLLWSADYYRHPVGEVIAAAMPAPLRVGAPLREETIVWSLTDLGRREALAQLTARAVRLRAIVAALGASGEMTADALLAAAESTPELLRKLEARGYVIQTKRAPATELSTPAPRAGPTLNDAQREAVQRIRGTLGTFASHLLYGVTGSGKTEVYLRTIAAVIERKEQALVLVPEIALTPQLIARFRARFDAPLAVVHSNLSDGERLAAWRSAGEGRASIVIGTRSAVFSPLARPGLIVVDEEHDASFKQQEGLRYSARDAAVYRAKLAGCPVVLGTATPSLETWHNWQLGRYERLELPERASPGAKLPAVRTIDLRDEPPEQGLCKSLLQAIQKRLADREQSLIFINRRGYAPVLACEACGWTAGCERCTARMVLHAADRRLRCHHCGAQGAIPRACPTCGNVDLKAMGRGTQRVEETLAARFPGARIVRIDRDSARRRAELSRTLEGIRRGEGDILVGTQLLAKGHDFPALTLVGVLNADSALVSTDYRAPERLFAVLAQVAGRAGRRERPGEVLIQTRYPRHPLFAALERHDFAGFAQSQLAERRAAGFPPFVFEAALRAEATRLETALEFLRKAAASVHPPEGVRVFDPVPHLLTRRAGLERAQLVMQSPSRPALQEYLGSLSEKLFAEAERHVRWHLDVDPIEFD